MFEAKHPTLELDWLPLSLRKSLDQPRVVFTGAVDCSGRYWRREWGEKPILTPFDFDLREAAIIEIGMSPGCGGTIAHEYRHHIQLHHNLFQPFRSLWNPRDDSMEAYCEEIRRYFTEYPEERDALEFQVRVAPNDSSLSRLDFLRGHRHHV